MFGIRKNTEEIKVVVSRRYLKIKEDLYDFNGAIERKMIFGDLAMAEDFLSDMVATKCEEYSDSAIMKEKAKKKYKGFLRKENLFYG